MHMCVHMSTASHHIRPKSTTLYIPKSLWSSTKFQLTPKLVSLLWIRYCWSQSFQGHMKALVDKYKTSNIPSSTECSMLQIKCTTLLMFFTRQKIHCHNKPCNVLMRMKHSSNVLMQWCHNERFRTYHIYNETFVTVP